MKSTLHSLQARVVLTTTIIALFALSLFSGGRVNAASKTWSGQGQNGRWQTDSNWFGGRPSAGDSLIFTGTTRTANTNDFAGGTVFNGISFQTVAGAFTLTPASAGNTITNTGDLTNNQVVVTETINIPMTFDTTHNINVITNGNLTIGAVISGQNAGINKYGGGTLKLTAANTFSNTVNVSQGTVFIISDSGLGLAPITNNVPAAIVLGPFGALQVTNTLTLNANRGIAMGQTDNGTNSGTISVDPFVRRLTYSGNIIDQTTGGGLTKSGFGALALYGSNSYSGPTTIKVGTLELNYTNATSPLNNMINPVSKLVLGGANSGIGTTNFAELLMIPGPGEVNNQTFASTHLTFGGSVIQVNSNNGTGNLNLGLLDHDPGAVTVIVPPWAQGGLGNIVTTTTNIHGLLGGWATLGSGRQVLGITIGTNYACVDGLGNIINFTNYLVYSSGTIHDVASPDANIMVDSSTAGDVRVDNDGASRLTEVNTISFRRGERGSTAPMTFIIGTNNSIRFGKWGGIFKQDTQSGITWVFGEGAGGANAVGSQDIGVVTAGGADNTDGEIVADVNNTSSSSGTLIIDGQITDNGSGKVAFVKTGGGSMKLRGRNTYTGGCFLLQGRVQFVGAETGPGGANPDAGGTGPIYVLPGAYIFPSGTGPTNVLGVTNAVFSAGNGTFTEPLGAIRGSSAWKFSGPWTLIGDTCLGGNATPSGAIAGKISGPFNLTIGSLFVVGGTVALSNPSNDWSGNTILQARNNAAAGNVFIQLTNEVIPNGFGKGNVVMDSGTGGNTWITWQMNGFNETINGLSIRGNTFQARGAGCFIQNDVANVTSTLTVGDNDQSSTFNGIIWDGNGPMALTKIGGGILTLNNTNNYSGPTTVSAGTLAIVGASTAIIRSPNIIVSNATLDVSQTTDGTGVRNGRFTGNGAGSVALMSGGTLIGNTSPQGVGFLSISNGTTGGITEIVNPAVTNVFATSLKTGGTTNLINITSVQNVSGYPSTFDIIFTVLPGITGSGFNFGIGSVPTPLTKGYMTNDANNVKLVLLDGPKTQIWKGNDSVNPTFWDSTTTNWLAFGLTADTYFDQDTPLFGTAGVAHTIDIVTNVIPAEIIVSNVVAYTFTNIGNISGVGDLIKMGSGNLTIANGDPYNPITPAPNNFRGGISILGGNVTFVSDGQISGGVTITNGSIVYVGVGGTNGTLPSGTIANNGALVFNRTDTALTVGGPITGSGNITNIGTGAVAIGGANSYTGRVEIVNGTLIANSGTALGLTTKTNVNRVEVGATLDDNGQNLGASPVVVAANNTGVGGNGAIVNNSANQQISALRDVSLEGNATFGGYSRWDIRLSGGIGRLNTYNNPYSLTKVGTNAIGLVGIAVDPAFTDLIIQQGLVQIATSINGGSGLGDASYSVIVSNGATFEVYGLANTMTKKMVLNGNGTNTTLSCASGVGNNWQGAVTLAGNCVVNCAAGTGLIIGGAISDGVSAGSLTVNGAGTVSLTSGTLSYSGTTVVTNGGTLYADGSGLGSGATVYPGGTLGGNGTIGNNVTIMNGSLTPGDPNTSPIGHMTVFGSLTLSNSVNAFTIENATGPDVPFLSSDSVEVTNKIDFKSTTNVFNIHVDTFTVKNNIYTLMRCPFPLVGVTSNKVVINAEAGYAYHLLDPSVSFIVSGVPYYGIRIAVDAAIGNDTWTGANANLWDTNTAVGSKNWSKTGVAGASFFTDTDFANFTDVSAISGHGWDGNTNVFISLGTPVKPGAMRFYNDNNIAFTFYGSGSISGTNGMTLESGQGTSAGWVILANTGSNDFTGDINIVGGGVQVGTNSPSGNLGIGGAINMVTTVASNNNAAYNKLVYYRSDDLVQSNNITGGGTILKKGAGNVTLQGIGNSWTGNVIVAQGTLTIDNPNPIGESVDSYISVSNGAALGISGADATASALILANTVIVGGGGPGFGTNGAIVNNGGIQQISALGGGLWLQTNVVFGGSPATDSTNTLLLIGGNPGRWDLRVGSSSATNCILSTYNVSQGMSLPYSITKVGSNQVNFVNVMVDPALGNIDVEQGILGWEANTTSMGAPGSNIFVNVGALLQFYSCLNPWNKNFILNGNGVNPTISIGNGSGATTPTIVGPIQLNGTVLMDCPSGSLIISNNISGTGSLLKGGANALTLAGVNSYSGAAGTEINNGSLILEGDTDLANSPVINMSGTGARLIVDLRTDRTLTLQGSQLLEGVGQIIGNLEVAAGTSLQPGINLGTTNGPVGTLTVSNVANLDGNIYMYLDKSGNVSARLQGAQSIACSGSLFVTNLTQGIAPLANGDAFTLFSATNISGTFSALNLQTLGAGLAWDTTHLADVVGPGSMIGKLFVISSVTNHPKITRDTLTFGTNLVIHGSNGVPSASVQFYVLSSTNVAAPLTNHTASGWTVLSTNFFNADGSFDVTNTIPAGSRARFIAIQVP